MNAAELYKLRDRVRQWGLGSFDERMHMARLDALYVAVRIMRAMNSDGGVMA